MSRSFILLGPRRARVAASRPTGASPLLLLACLSLPAAAHAQTAERWWLMARHGECAPVAGLKRKVPDLGDIQDPEAFTALMRRKGLAVASKRTTLPQGAMHEVSVPAQELALVFVTAGLCNEFSKTR